MTDPRAQLIDEAFDHREALSGEAHRDAVLSVVDDLDRGRLRVADSGE